MARTERLFDIIQMIRSAQRPVRAAQIAETLGVSRRTIYRDIAHLQARRVPILGEAGSGYVMRRGYDLPPLSFDEDEAEAVTLGLSLIARTGDPALWRAAQAAARKLAAFASSRNHLIASSWGSESPPHVDPGSLRRAIRAEQKLRLTYAAPSGERSERTIWPLALIYYSDNALLVSWCEWRQDFRHFRLDRMQACTALADRFTGAGAGRLADWERAQKPRVVDVQPLM